MKNVKSVRSKFLLLLAVMLFCALPMSASAANLYVGGSACDYSTIQSAINAASNGDNIYVHEGTYVEQIDYLGKSIVVKSLLGAALTTIDANGGAKTVTMSVSEGSVATLDGFTVTGAVGQGIYSTCGNLQSTSLIIKNCIITENNQGTYLYGANNYNSHNNALSITDCEITNNSGAVQGTGMYVTGYNTINVINSEISNNTGGVFGGGVYVLYSSNILFENCDIKNNYAKYDGGGIFLNRCSDSIINKCYIRNNTISYSGGTFNGRGSAIYILGGDGVRQINNCVITDNSTIAPEPKGSVSIGGLVGESFEVNINSCTIANNYASTSGNYLMCGGVYFGTPLSLNVNNSILWGNTTPNYLDVQIFAAGGSTITVDYTDIESGWTGAGTGNIDSDPLFVGSGDYHLTGSSPCIDVGDTTLDVDFEATSRPRGSADDMGADEY